MRHTVISTGFCYRKPKTFTNKNFRGRNSFKFYIYLSLRSGDD